MRLNRFFLAIKEKLSRVRLGINTIGFILTLLSFYYLARLIFNINFSVINAIDIFWVIQLVFFVLLVYIPLVLLGSYCWKFILEFVSQRKIPFRFVFPIFARSNFVKYVPGTLPQYIVRNILGKKLGWKHKEIVLSSIIEIIFVICVNVFICILFLLTGYFDVIFRYVISYLNIKPFILFALIMCALTIVFVLAFRKIEFLQKCKNVLFTRSFLKLFLKYFVICSISALAVGLLFAFIYYFLFDFQLVFHDMMYISGAFIISAFLGYMVPGSPAGLGVREYSLVVLLSPVYGEANILIASLIYRIINIIADSMIFVAGEVLLKRKNINLKMRI